MIVVAEFDIDVDGLVADLCETAVDEAEAGKDQHDAVADAIAAHLEAVSFLPIERMFVVETLLATRGLDAATARHHLLEDLGGTTDAMAIVDGLYRNALTSAVQVAGFDEPIRDLERLDAPPPRELIVDVEGTVTELENDAIERSEAGADAFDAACDAIDDRFGELKARSLTEQVAIVEYLVSTHGVEEAAPGEQLEAAVHDGTDLVVGSLLWHSLHQHLMDAISAAGE